VLIIARNWYRDADSDTYGKTSPTAACGTAGYVGNTMDCYDSSSNAKPGQTSYFGTDRGDGSYDYNCNGTETKFSTQTCVGTTPVSIPANACSGQQDFTSCASVTSPAPACGQSEVAAPGAFTCGDAVETPCTSCNMNYPGGVSTCR
jgi:hypothetical protein